jgi:hypothetical protein
MHIYIYGGQRGSMWPRGQQPHPVKQSLLRNPKKMWGRPKPTPDCSAEEEVDYIYKLDRTQSLRKSLVIIIFRKAGGGKGNELGLLFLSKNSSKCACTGHAGTSEHIVIFHTPLLYQFCIPEFHFMCFTHIIVLKSSKNFFIQRKFQKSF